MSVALSLAHFTGGMLLLCGLWLLVQRRLAGMIGLYQLQSLLLAAAAAWQGIAQAEAGLVLTGIITLAAKGLVLPCVLREIVRRFGLARAVERTLPVAPTLLLGVGVIGIAMLVVPPGPAGGLPLARADLALALAVVLLGLLVMVSRRTALAQIIGFLAAENGLVLAAIAMPGLPFVAAGSVALLVLPACLAGGVFLLRIQGPLERPGLIGVDETERGRR